MLKTEKAKTLPRLSALPTSLEEWVLQNLEDDLEDIAKYGAYDYLDDTEVGVLHDTYEKEIWKILAQRSQKKSCFLPMLRITGVSALEVLRAFSDKDGFLSGILNDLSDVSRKTSLVCYAVEKIAVEHYTR